MSSCRVCGSNLKEYFLWKNFPISNTCTTSKQKEDVFYNFGLGVSDIGLIQQIESPNIDILYKESHNSSVGKLWETHNNSFVKFINNYIKDDSSVCEIGSGNGKIVNMLSREIKIDCYDPSPSFEESCNIKIYKKYFECDKKYDVVFCSHTLEHIIDIKQFLSQIKQSLNENGKFVFSVPDSEYGFKNNIITTLNTEHIYYFTENSLRNVLSVCGFKILDFQKFDNHSLFVSCVIDNSNLVSFSNIDVESFVDHIEKSVVEIKNVNDCYIFGCHMMSSIFLYFNKTNDVIGVIDNDMLKNSKRLYGTSLICKKPQTDNMNLILNGGIYHDEIFDSLKNFYNIYSWR